MTKALIIIDMINADVPKRADKNELIKNQLKLIRAFQKRKYPVILTGGTIECDFNPVTHRLYGDEYAGKNDDPKQAAKEESYDIDIIEELQNTKPDKIIRKCEYSAFYNTELDQYCKNKKISDLYFCGISSGCCVYFTAVDALYRKIQPNLITDASGSDNEKKHKQNAENFNSLIGPVLKTEQLLENLER